MKIKVKVFPRAKEQRVLSVNDQEFKVWLTAPPEKNKANAELIKIIAKYFAISRSHVRIIQGLKSWQKVLLIENHVE